MRAFVAVLLFMWSTAGAFRLTRHSMRNRGNIYSHRGDEVSTTDDKLQRAVTTELQQIRQSRIAVEVLSCVTEQLVSIPHAQILTELGVDDLIMSLPYTISQDEDVIRGLGRDQQGDEQEKSSNATDIFLLVVTPGNCSLSIAAPVTLHNVSAGHHDESLDCGEEDDEGTAVIVVRKIVRYCAPPLLYQYLPHRLPHMILQSVDVKQFILQTQDALHLLLNGPHAQ